MVLRGQGCYWCLMCTLICETSAVASLWWYLGSNALSRALLFVLCAHARAHVHVSKTPTMFKLMACHCSSAVIPCGTWHCYEGKALNLHTTHSPHAVHHVVPCTRCMHVLLKYLLCLLLCGCPSPYSSMQRATQTSHLRGCSPLFMLCLCPHQ